MLIELKDLRKGDEIIVSSNSRLKYLKILRNPVLGKRVGWQGGLLYKSLMCSSRRDEVTYTFHYSNPKYTPKTIKRKEFQCTAEGHNIERYENLNYRTMWLVKRENI